MTSEKKKQKSRDHSSINLTQLEIRIPRVPEMDYISIGNEKKVKFSHLSPREVTQELPNETENAHLQGDEIKERLGACHQKLLKNNELLSKAADSLKQLDLEKLRKQIHESKILDTAQCFLQDEEELKHDRDLIEQQLSDFRKNEKAKRDLKQQQQQQPLQDLNDSLKEIVQTFNKIKHQVDSCLEKQ